MRIKSNAILTGVVIVLGIILFVNGLRSVFVFNANAIGGSILICLGLAPIVYGIVTIRDYILHRKSRHPRLHTT